jgi:transcription initiation factor TFIIIB Brf1 subunit/transcription initiation factor TFIIB
MSRNVSFAANTAAEAPAPAYSSSRLICPNCGSKEIEQHGASGASICTDCGVVVEENAIVSSVEFVEGAGGASSMVGQFVSATSSKAYTGGGRGGRYGFSRDSRETTLANGRRRIQDVASRLRLGSHYVDAAHRLFTIAVEKNFVQGRRTTHVVAACLYIACRQEKSQHMLIDFSDALQVNVYTLGTCFLKFRRLLGLKLEIIDPALYVYRFAAHLDLDQKANAVALTALRLVGRMKRDWIVAGRRPAGICAAALLIAARAHGFSRHHQDVTRILRVCGLTVTNRVKEFEQTPSATLTLEQFNTVELEAEADPPVFTRNRIREARARAIQEGNVQLLTSGALDDPSEGKHATMWRKGGRMPKNREEHAALYLELAKDLKHDTEENKDEGQSEENAQERVDGEPKTPDGVIDPTATIGICTKEDVSEEEKAENEHEQTHDEAMAEDQQIVPRTDGAVTAPNPVLASMYPKSKYGRVIVLPNQATEEELQVSTQPNEDKLNLQHWKTDMPEAHVEDIDSLFRSDEEMAQKEAIFNSLNKEYLEQQERKEAERQQQEAASTNKEQDELAQAEGHARYLTKRGRKRKSGGPQEEAQQTTEEALFAAVSARKISRKINYDAMSAIFDDDGGFANEEGEDHQPSDDVDPEFAMV